MPQKSSYLAPKLVLFQDWILENFAKIGIKTKLKSNQTWLMNPLQEEQEEQEQKQQQQEQEQGQGQGQELSGTYSIEKFWTCAWKTSWVLAWDYIHWREVLKWVDGRVLRHVTQSNGVSTGF